MRATKTVLFVLFLGLSCSEGPEPMGTMDDDVDPEIIADLEGKADGDPCASHSGGSLSGDDLLVAINKEDERQLQSAWQPPDIVEIDDTHMMPGRSGLARLAAVEAFYEMAAAGEAEAGLSMGIRSAYRSYVTQCYTFNYKVETRGYEHASRYSARPGRSEHQLGTALDITNADLDWSLSSSVGSHPLGIWLAENAHRFGFGLSYPRGQEALTGYGYEPWHWRYIGREAAQEMHDEGLMLIEYLLACDDPTTEMACPREAAPVIEPNRGFIGGRCTGVDECSIGPDATCLDTFEGSCSVPCDLYCPDRAGQTSPTFCVANEPDDGQGMCYSQCDDTLYPDTAGCREGYSCQPASRPNEQGDAMVCLPAQ